MKKEFNSFLGKEIPRTQEISNTQKILNRFAEEKKNKERAEGIICPYCKHEQDQDLMYHHVSYWGEDSKTKMCCESCNVYFYVEEMVSRTFETTTTQWEEQDEKRNF